MEYKHHLETNYCVSGEGEVEDLATGQVFQIRPGTVYALDKHDAHIMRARTELGVPALPSLGVQFLQRGRRHGIAQLFLLMPAESRRRGRAAT